MLDAKRLLIDAVCVTVLAFLMIWGANAIAEVPLTLPAPANAADCNTPAPAQKPTTTAGGLPGLNLAECGDAKTGPKATEHKPN